MKKLFLGGLAVFALMIFGCGESKEISPEKIQHQTRKLEDASQAYSAAVVLAESNDPAGFLKLYEIATNDQIYTVEYSEVANEELLLLLYAKPVLWIKTFSQVDFEKFKQFVIGIEVSQLPEGVISDEQFKNEILTRLEKFNGNKNEIKLVDHILGLYNRKRAN